MDGAQELKLQLQAEAIADLWQEQCSMHTRLFELTCDEYTHLLSSDMDELDDSIEQKRLLIQDIEKMDSIRKALVQEMNAQWSEAKIEKVHTLVEFLNANGQKSNGQRIEKLNLILMDIIDKIQAQNKKNQLFLNKALISLRELKESFGGNKKNYKTYGSNGATRSNLGR
ncbi:MAG: flagellar protein FlgN [Bacteriovoracaceae bacterium]|nr:flagellar protein FlgN [Bacteriovoracaceae bacterium]